MKKDHSKYNRLSKKLKEVSALTVDSSGHLFTLNDEDGKIYRLNPETYSIEETINFKEKGDYEGLTIVNQDFFVLKSKGDLLKVNQKGDVLKIYKAPKALLGLEFEGVVYSMQDEKLLLACKNHPDNKLDSFINIYSFSLENYSFDSIPKLQINKSEKLKKFKASGLAIDSNQLYVLSGRSAQLIVYNLAKDRLERVIEFELSELPQLEGVILWKQEIIIVSEKAGNKTAFLYRFKTN